MARRSVVSIAIRSDASVDNGNNVLLDIKNLRTQFFTEDGVVRAVDGIDFDVLSNCTRAHELFVDETMGDIRILVRNRTHTRNRK